MPVEPSKAKQTKRVAGAAGYWCAALDPRGQRLYCGATDFAIHVFDAASMAEQPVTLLKGHRSYVTALAYSRGAETLVSGGFDRQLMGWRGDSATPAWTAPAGALVNQLAVSPDGVTVASAQDDLAVRLWETATGKAVRTLSGHHAPRTVIGRNSTLYTVAFSPDGKRLASGDRIGGVCVWDTESGALLRKLDARELYTDNFAGNKLNFPPSEYDWGGVRSLAFSPDGRLLFAGGMGPADQNSAGLDGLMKIEVFDLETGKNVHGFLLEKSKGVLSAMAVHPEGRWLAAAGGGGGAGTGGSGTLCLWDHAARGADGKPAAPLLFQTPMVVRGLVFSADGAQALLVGMEKGVMAGRVEVWSLG